MAISCCAEADTLFGARDLPKGSGDIYGKHERMFQPTEAGGKAGHVFGYR
jgi:hypothetical protein